MTHLESLRYWREREGVGIEALIADLTHTAPPSPAMLAGRALAKIMEDPVLKREGLVSASMDGWDFLFECDCELPEPQASELKASIIIPTSSGNVLLTGKVDMITGRVIRDQKLTERWDAERYVDSLQWRAYLSMFKAQEFVYDVFVGRYKDQSVTVTEYHPMRFFSYPDMDKDVHRAVEELAYIVRQHEIFPELPDG